METTTYVVMVGNIVDGVEFIGPFIVASDAHEWADEHVNDEYLVVSMRAAIV